MLYVILILLIGIYAYLTVLTHIMLNKRKHNFKDNKNTISNEFNREILDVLIPMNRAPKISFDYTVKDIKTLMNKIDRYTVPIYDKVSEQIKCVVTLQDIYALPDDTVIREIKLKMPTFIYIHHPAKKAISNIIATDTDMCVVIDEYGTVQGIVYLYDLLGRLYHDNIEIDDINNGCVYEDPELGTVARGDTTIYQLNNIFDLSIKNAHYNTLNGIIIYELNKFPEVGDKITIDGYTLEVVEVDDLCVNLVKICWNEE